ncbi:unnamed protein product [Oppiella nova]|uniref:Amino acid transporter n=1 Tax=Oppiella nova TaxID=334625 RepID=A0A7R9QVI9_9ACAR|nr:unnamed protein product [Oppiella nova]CAG2177174.1 unnamed protein product [Oppiella nova]
MLAIKFDNHVQIIQAIVEHNYYATVVARFNRMTLLTRLLAAQFVVVFVFILLLFIMCSRVSTAAQRPYPTLLAYMTTAGPTLSVRHRLTIDTFIQQLSGPDIGYYCYDLFPMNSYEFPVIILALGTASSAITLPVIIESMEKNVKLPESVTRFVLPLGMNVHMNGFAMYYPMVILFVAQMHGMDVGVQHMVILTYVLYLVN